MTTTVWPVDAVSSAPSYSGRMLRQTTGGAIAKSTSRPVGARSGVWPGTPTTTVSVSGGNALVGVHGGVLDLESSAVAGPYIYSNDASVNAGAVTTADGTNPRIDIVYALLEDPAESDGSSVPLVSFHYLAGSPAPSPAAPAVPNSRCMVLANISVPNTGGGGVGSATVTWVAKYANTAGGVALCTFAARPSGPHDGEFAFETDTKHIIRYDATAGGWKSAVPIVMNSAAEVTQAFIQSGTFTSVFSSTSATTGTLTFSQAFSAAPVVQMTVQVGSNLDLLVNMTAAPSASSVAWRLAQKAGSSVSGTATVHWTAIGPL